MDGQKLVTLLSAGDVTTVTATGATFTGNSVNCCVSLTVTGTTGTTKEVTATLQASLDGSTGWFDVDSTNAKVKVTGNGSGGFAKLSLAYPYLRCSIAKHADTTAGLAAVAMWLKN